MTIQSVRMCASDPSVAATPGRRIFSWFGGGRRPSQGVSLKVLIAVVVAGRIAAAERTVTVEVVAPAPLQADDVRRALGLRLARTGAAVHVRVAPTAAGLEVAAGGGAREISIAGLSVEAATRLVALTASDLLLDELAPLPRPPASHAWSIGLSTSAAGWEAMLGGVAGEVAVARGGVVGVAELGAATLLAGPLQLDGATLRLDAGVRRGIVELRGGATLAAIRVGDGAGDRTVLAGANASVRVRLPVASRVRAVFGLGADAFATRTIYRTGGMTVLATPRVAPGFTAGVELVP